MQQCRSTHQQLLANSSIILPSDDATVEYSFPLQERQSIGGRWWTGIGHRGDVLGAVEDSEAEANDLDDRHLSHWKGTVENWSITDCSLFPVRVRSYRRYHGIPIDWHGNAQGYASIFRPVPHSSTGEKCNEFKWHAEFRFQFDHFIIETHSDSPSMGDWQMDSRPSSPQHLPMGLSLQVSSLRYFESHTFDSHTNRMHWKCIK